jgi:acetyl-CoA carboxylase biotin carboxyl carrier protein
MEPDKRVLNKLVELMQREGLERIRVQVGETDIDLRMSVPNQFAAPVAAPDHHARPAAAGSSAATEQSRALPANIKKVLAPLVGLFYRAPAPGAPAFCETGGVVTEGQVLCILEAMKLMNEIVSEFDGTVAKICVNDGDLVTLNQELMWIET